MKLFSRLRVRLRKKKNHICLFHLCTQRLDFEPRVQLGHKESLQTHEAASLSSVSCSENLGRCLKVNAINSIYFSLAALFSVLSPYQTPSPSPCALSAIPPFIPVVPPLLHLSTWNNFSQSIPSSFFVSSLASSLPLFFISFHSSLHCHPFF